MCSVCKATAMMWIYIYVLDFFHFIFKTITKIGPMYVCTTGYDNPSSEWEEYPPYLNIEGMEVASTVSLIFILHVAFSLFIF